MKTRSIVALICMLASLLNAQQVPPATVIGWFNDVCNRPAQVEAFYTIIQFMSGRDFTGPFTMIEVKPEYDTQAVKDAFEVFVRSRTVNIPDCGGNEITSVDLSYYNGDWEQEGNIIEQQILSLYINWGFQTDLYEIVEKLHLSDDPAYSSYVIDKIAVGYFNYVKTKLQSQIVGYRIGVAHVVTYLIRFKNPSPENVQAALDVLHTYATSSLEDYRIWAVESLVDVYAAGYEQVGTDLLALKNDSSEDVKTSWRYQITKAHKYDQLLEFEVEYDE
ncbi:hypothetical protein HQ587_03010 [bacterium]|nr:hypothetical protein [bacterium]